MRAQAKLTNSKLKILPQKLDSTSDITLRFFLVVTDADEEAASFVVELTSEDVVDLKPVYAAWRT